MKIEISPAYQSNTEICKLMNELPESFTQGGNPIVKKRSIIKKTHIIKAFTLGSDNEMQHKIVVKQFRKPLWIQRVIYSFFRKSKAKRAYYNGIVMSQRGIDTPIGIGYAEQWEMGLFKQGYYVSEYTAAPSVNEKLIEPQDFDKIMACDFAKFVATLHNRGILHDDLNPTNVLFSEINGHYQFSLIDISRMKIKPQNKELTRSECLHNLTKCTNRKDLFKFIIREYAACRGWHIEDTLNEAIHIKVQYDKRRHRRQTIHSIFKRRERSLIS